MDQLLRDIRFAARTLVKYRGFTLVAVLTLGLGIGANTAIFSVVDGVLLKPLPYESGDRLLLIRQSAPLAGRPNAGVSIKELYDYREQTGAFDALVEYHQMNFDLLKRGEPDRVNVGVVSHDFFDVLGIKPALGRSFVAHDDARGADAVLILSYSYWQTKFGGDPRIVGQVFEMNDRPHTVVGVLPNVPLYPQENDVYMPVSACPFRAAAEQRIAQNRRVFSGLTVFGRVKNGLTAERARTDVDVVCSRFTRENPTVYRPGSGFAATTLAVRDELTRNARPMLLILLGTTGLILLIACANVANLTLARLLRRERELAVRTALGAGRAQLIRQLLTESTLLALAGGAVGVVFAASTLSLLTAFVGRFTSRTGEIGLDPTVLAFTVIVSTITGLVFGTFPALSSRVDLVNAMKQGSRGGGTTRGRRTLQSALIVAQVAVSVVLLVGAGLLLASFYRLQQVDAGYRGDRVLSAEAFTNFSKYPDAASQIRFYQPVLERLRAEPGVVSAAVTNAVPLSASTPNATPFQIEGSSTDDPDKRPAADVRVVTPGYFETLGIPLVNGRAFSDHDGTDAAAVAIVNKSMTRYWEKRDPIGSRVSFDNGQTWATIVGVVGDVRQFGLERDSIAQAYTPLSQSQGLAGRFLVRTTGDPVGAAKMIREDVHLVDPNMPVENVRTLDDLRERYLATPKLTATLLTVFAVLAALVTMAGITGVIATSVSQRIAEFGVRMALGASRDRVLALVIRQGLTLVAFGLCLGVAGSIALTRVLSAYLFDTTPTDPATFAGVAASFVIAGAIACLGPAWRATRVDPMLALRAE
jgi:putative ABC transport system permease protein